MATKDTKKIKKSKYRHFFGQRNYEYEISEFKLDDNGNPEKDDKGNHILVKKDNYPSEEDWKAQVIAELTDSVGCDNYSEIYIMFHDRDLTNDEERKLRGLHVHFVVTYPNGRYRNSVRQLMKCNDNPKNFEPCASRTSSLLYLTHTTPESIKEKKTRYNVSEMIINTNMYLNQTRDDGMLEIPRLLNDEEKELHYRLNIAGRIVAKSNAKIQKELVDSVCISILQGELTLTEVLDYLELKLQDDRNTAFRIWYDNKKRFEEAEREYQSRRFQELLTTGRDLSTLYISGDGGLGKTFIARSIIQKYISSRNFPDNSKHGRIHTVANSGGRKLDFLSGYDFQAVTLFDDLSYSAFDYFEFLNVFDRTQMNLYSSRFNNKAWFSEFAVITRSTPIKDYIDNLCKKELDKVLDKLPNEDVKDTIKNDEGLNTTYNDTQIEYNNVLYQVQRRVSYILEVSKTRERISENEPLGLNVVATPEESGFYVFRLMKYVKDTPNGRAKAKPIKEYRSTFKTNIMTSEDEGADDVRSALIEEIYKELDFANLLGKDKKSKLLNDVKDYDYDKYRELYLQGLKLKVEFYNYTSLLQLHKSYRVFTGAEVEPIIIDSYEVIMAIRDIERASSFNMDSYPLNDLIYNVDTLDFYLNEYCKDLYNQLNTKDFKKFIKDNKGLKSTQQLLKMLKKKVEIYIKSNESLQEE